MIISYGKTMADPQPCPCPRAYLMGSKIRAGRAPVGQAHITAAWHRKPALKATCPQESSSTSNLTSYVISSPRFIILNCQRHFVPSFPTQEHRESGRAHREGHLGLFSGAVAHSSYCVTLDRSPPSTWAILVIKEQCHNENRCKPRPTPP